MIELPVCKTKEELAKIPWWNFGERKRQAYNLAVNIDDCLMRMNETDDPEEYKTYAASLKYLEECYDTLRKPGEIVKTCAQAFITTGMGIGAAIIYGSVQNKMLDGGSSSKITDKVVDKLIFKK